jgi:hypothetical protein
MNTLVFLHNLAQNSPAVANYFHLLNLLQHVHGQCGVVEAPSHVVYGGSCLQAFLTASQSHDVSFVWNAASAAQAGVTGVFGY